MRIRCGSDCCRALARGRSKRSNSERTQPAVISAPRIVPPPPTMRCRLRLRRRPRGRISANSRAKCRPRRREMAEGWPGNRKAFISHVWNAIRDSEPQWGISEIEFKCMLAEAHRAGRIVLANADLKDKKNLKAAGELRRPLQECRLAFRAC